MTAPVYAFDLTYDEEVPTIAALCELRRSLPTHGVFRVKVKSTEHVYELQHGYMAPDGVTAHKAAIGRGHYWQRLTLLRF